MPTTFANTIDGNEILAKRSQCDYAGNDIQTTYATKSEVTTGLSGKQDTISDLATIRSGAADGATAVQPSDLATVATTGAYSDLSGTPTIPPALSAGNGIDITNNVVSADLDGTSLTNGANGLSVTLPVPDTTGASQGDVLSVGQSGLEWVAPSGSSDLFYATSSTTFNEIQNAVNDGKYVILSHQGSLFPLTKISGTGYFAKAYFHAIDNPYNSSDRNNLRLITFSCSYNNQWRSYNTFVPPDSSASDAGKVLTVNSSGNAEWATPSGGGSVTDVEVNGTSVVNASGVAEVTVPSGAQLVPAATSSDADKVLTVDGQGIPGWAVVSASDVFVAKYNTTTWTDVSTAYADGKVIFLEVTDASIPYPYRLNSTAQIPLAAIRTGSVEACAVFIGSSLGTTTGTGENTSWPVYILGSNNTWTTQTRLAYPSFTSSDYNKVLTVVNNGSNSPVLQWSATQSGGVTDVEVDGTSVVSGGVASITMPTVDQTYNSASTDAQSGVAVAGALSTKQDTISDLATIRSGAADGATAVQPGDLATVATTGSYSDLSGTPTILPYKPVVAGTGVRIVDDTANNRIVVEADETVLWSGSDTTAALSESYTNFERIRVVYNTNDNSVYDTVFYSSQSGTSFVVNASNCNSTQTQYKMARFSLTSQSITFHSASTISFTDNGFAARSTTNPVTLIKVVGINRVASN